MPGGVNHDARRVEPFPPYIVSASGSRKRDVDGNEFIDYVMGHAALILGHAHPEIVSAVQKQVAIVSHPGACHPLEVEWADLVSRLVPSVETVRFVMSGTEATLLALRVARAFSGRQVICRVQGHFHGWQDYVAGDTNTPGGVPDAVRASVRVARLNDIEDLEAQLEPRDVAAVILEPEGARSGTIPPPPGYLEQVRDLTKATGTLLIFDEVVSGFRVSPGGVQQQAGVLPDLTALAKTVAGGMPGGALGGGRDIMEVLVFGHPSIVPHQGTWNANPISAVAGVTALKILSDNSIHVRLNEAAHRLRTGLNRVIAEARVPGFAFGQNSSFRVILGDDLPVVDFARGDMAEVPPARLLQGIKQPLAGAVYRALLLEGLDFMRGGYGWLSIAHRDIDIEATLISFERVLRRLLDEGLIRPAVRR
jgi:glutamate-1-semialdehyde 2,1-aminomutase